MPWYQRCSCQDSQMVVILCILHKTKEYCEKENVLWKVSITKRQKQNSKHNKWVLLKYINKTLHWLPKANNIQVRIYFASLSTRTITITRVSPVINLINCISRSINSIFYIKICPLSILVGTDLWWYSQTQCKFHWETQWRNWLCNTEWLAGFHVMKSWQNDWWKPRTFWELDNTTIEMEKTYCCIWTENGQNIQ